MFETRIVPATSPTVRSGSPTTDACRSMGHPPSVGVRDTCTTGPMSNAPRPESQIARNVTAATVVINHFALFPSAPTGPDLSPTEKKSRAWLAADRAQVGVGHVGADEGREGRPEGQIGPERDGPA